MAFALIKEFRKKILSREVKTTVIKLQMNLQMNLKRYLAAFDFDYTLADDNTDSQVAKLLQNIPQYVQNLIVTEGWTSYMNEIFKLLHQNNISKEEIRKAVVSIPPVPKTVEMLARMKEFDCEVIIISDANTFFIHEWLKANDLLKYVDKIYSNPAEFVGDKLQIKGYHVQDWCKLSPRNLCKSYILFEHIAERQNAGTLFRYIVFCGDGDNDLCPSLKLRPDDMIFARKNFPLHKLLKKFPIKAKVIEWEDGDTIIQTLQQL